VDQGVTANQSRERAKELAGDPPRQWYVQAVFYRTDTDSIWVHLAEISPQPETAGLVVPASHLFYKDWAGLPIANGVSVTLSVTEDLFDRARPESPASYLGIATTAIGEKRESDQKPDG